MWPHAVISSSSCDFWATKSGWRKRTCQQQQSAQLEGHLNSVHWCHDPSHGGSYMAEGAFCIRIGLPPRVVSGDCLVASCIRLVVDWLVVPFIVAAHIRCLVIGVVLVRIVDPPMFLSRLCGPGGYPYLHMSVRFHGSLYPMTDFTLRAWYGLFTPHVCWCSMGFFTILLLIATVLGSRYFSDWYHNTGRCGLQLNV